jgi:hypothetical protein
MRVEGMRGGDEEGGIRAEDAGGWGDGCRDQGGAGGGGMLQ